MKNNNIFISNSITIGLIKTALPSVFSMLAFSFSQIITSSFLQSSGKIELLTAVSVCYPLFMAVLSVGQGIGVAGCGLVAKSGGRNDSKSQRITVCQVLMITVGISAFITVLLLLLKQNLIFVLSYRFKIKETPEYYTVLALGSLFTVAIMVLNNLSRGFGYVWHSFISMLICCVSNIAGDYIVIYKTGAGASSIALSLVISQAIGCAYLVFILFVKNQIEFSFNKKVFKKVSYYIAAIGTPVFLTQLGAGITLAVLIYFASYSKEFAAGFVMGNKVYMVVFQAILGFTQGLLPFCAYFYGKNQKYNLKKGLYSALKICGVASILFTAVFMLFTKPVLSLFAGTGEIYLAAKTALVLRSITLFAASTVQVFTVYYQATSQKIKAAALSLLRQLIFLLPLCFTVRFLPFDKYTDICLAMPIADALTFMVCLFFIKSGTKSKRLS